MGGREFTEGLKVKKVTENSGMASAQKLNKTYGGVPLGTACR